MDDNYEDPVQRKPKSNNKYFIIVIAAVCLMILAQPLIDKGKELLTSIVEKDRPVVITATNNSEPVIAGDKLITRNENPETDISDQTEINTEGAINIKLRQGSFVPVNFKAGASSTPLNIQLTQDRYNDIEKEPPYSGQEQWYVHMDLGNRQDYRFHFILDLQEENRFLLYFDKNNNNDLTDDGVPLENRGSGAGGPGGFACTISIPWINLIENSPFKGNFNIWFFSNKSGWKKGNRVSHYSRTQLQGIIRIDNTEYLAMLIDQGTNDADLSNDGIAIDINQNGIIDRDERPVESHTINGKEYSFNIAW